MKVIIERNGDGERILTFDANIYIFPIPHNGQMISVQNRQSKSGNEWPIDLVEVVDVKYDYDLLDGVFQDTIITILVK